MKRTVATLAGMAILGVTVYLGTKAWAQQPAAQPPAPAPLRTRIALVNMATVIKGYKKAQDFQNQLINQGKGLDGQYLEPLRKQLVEKQKDYQNPSCPPAQHEQLERDLRKLQLEFREREEDCRKRMSSQQGVWTVQLYKEIEDAVRVYARSYDIELVMFYTDPTNPADPYDAAVIQRRLSMGAAMPMYASPGMDISDSVVTMLNRKLEPAAAAPAPTGGNIQPVSNPPRQ